MSVTKHDLRNILDEATTAKDLRSRIEELAEVSQIAEEQRTFVEMITRLNTALAKATGKKPREIDPTVTNYYSNETLVYSVGGYSISVSAFVEYESVSSIEVVRKRTGDLLADFRVYPLGPEKVVDLVVACINHLDNN